MFEGLYLFVCLFKEMLKKKKKDKNLWYFHRVDFSGIQNTNWHELVYKLISKRKNQGKCSSIWEHNKGKRKKKSRLL